MRSDTPRIDITDLERVGGRLGTNPAGIYRDRTGRRYYVKTLESEAHARNERIAARLYRLAGAPTLAYVETVASDQVATEWVELHKRCVAHFNEAERRAARRWFGVHAWTANWDAAGYDGDNQGVADGEVLTLDVGGALVFRAQGDPKGCAFGVEVEELERLRSDPGNPHAVELFSDMSSDEVRSAIKVVAQISDVAIHESIVAEGGSPTLALKMIARKEYMAGRL